QVARARERQCLAPPRTRADGNGAIDFGEAGRETRAPPPRLGAGERKIALWRGHQGLRLRKGCSKLRYNSTASSPALGPTPIGNATPGTICRPLEKLYAHRIPGLIDRASLAAVRPTPVTAASRVHTISTSALKVGRANHTTLAPRLHVTVVALSPTASLAEGVTVPPAFQWVTSLLATTMLAGTFIWMPSAPAPRSDLARPVGRSSENRGATDSRSAAAS